MWQQVGQKANSTSMPGMSSSARKMLRKWSGRCRKGAASRALQTGHGVGRA